MRGSLNQPIPDFLPFTIKIYLDFLIDTEIHISEKLFMFIFVQQLQVEFENFPEKVKKIQLFCSKKLKGKQQCSFFKKRIQKVSIEIQLIIKIQIYL